MTPITNSNINSLCEIIKDDCKELQQKEINLELFSNRVHYTASKLSLYFKAKTNEYIIVLRTYTGFLVNTFSDLPHAENEFLFLWAANTTTRGRTPLTFDSFYYVYDKSRVENWSPYIKSVDICNS
jgi:hypothetical protein